MKIELLPHFIKLSEYSKLFGVDIYDSHRCIGGIFTVADPSQVEHVTQAKASSSNIQVRCPKCSSSIIIKVLNF